jgi:DNA-binding NarL/FixJ family response regulator
MITADHGAARVVVLTTFDDDDYVYAALRAGASGFLVKDMALEDINVATAKAHVARLLAKLGARDRVQLVITACEAGLVSPSR